jgi:hypothetical protein
MRKKNKEREKKGKLVDILGVESGVVVMFIVFFYPALNAACNSEREKDRRINPPWRTACLSWGGLEKYRKLAIYARATQ